MPTTHNGAVIAGIMLSRAIPAVLAGPLAGILLDRFDRQRIMIASDLVRGVVALGFIVAIGYQQAWLLYLLSALLMLASPFFTSGRSAILPSIATEDELHTANSLTQTTGWLTLAVGAFFGGTTVAAFGYQLAFVFNSLSFFVSAFCISQLRSVRGHFRAENRSLNETKVARPWHEYREGLALHEQQPADSGHRPDCGGLGQRRRCGAGAIYVVQRTGVQARRARARPALGHGRGRAPDRRRTLATGWARRSASTNYKRTVFFCYLLHGGAYMVFSQMRQLGMGAVLHGLIACQCGGEFGLELVAALAAMWKTGFAAACSPPSKP